MKDAAIAARGRKPGCRRDKERYLVPIIGELIYMKSDYQK